MKVSTLVPDDPSLPEIEEKFEFRRLDYWQVIHFEFLMLLLPYYAQINQQ